MNNLESLAAGEEADLTAKAAPLLSDVKDAAEPAI